MMLLVLATVAGLAGTWTNEEQVSFAAEAGEPVPAWVGLRVTPHERGWRAVPVDAFGAAIGPARAVTAGDLAPPLRRARPFRCWAAIPNAGTDPVQWWGKRDIEIHDQGGRADLVTDEAVPQRFTLKLRNVVWPSGPNKPGLVLYVLTPAGGETAVAYSWADPEARRLGINIRTIQASCTRD